MQIILETERLNLRALTLADTEFIIELLNSEGWLTYIGDKNVKTKKQALKYLADGPIKSYEKNGFGLSLVELKETLTAVGMCGLIKRPDLDCPDIGFAFLPRYTGFGYASEIALATMHFAKTRLKIPNVYGISLPGNQKSIRVLEKIDLHFIKKISIHNSEEEILLYGC